MEPFTGKVSHRVRFDARYVVLAAGCMATPVLLQRSGNLANRSGQVGENLQFHPGVAVATATPGWNCRFSPTCPERFARFPLRCKRTGVAMQPAASTT